jgi:hypothetical protein
MGDRRPDGSTERLGTLTDLRNRRVALMAAIDQDRARLDELVTQHPELKSRSGPRPGRRR